MTIPSPRVPFRFESVAKLADGHELQSLIIPVEEGLRKFDQLYDEMLSSISGAFLIIRGQSGSGKSTLLETMNLFRNGVETVTITRDESIRDALKALPSFAGTIRVVVIADREALGDITDVEIETAVLATNAFIRSKEGERTAVVWPCNSDPIAGKLVEAAKQIGGEALVDVDQPVFWYSGPPKSEYLRIARNTIATFNFGASLVDLGISDQRAEQLVGQAMTIGSFLKLLQGEEKVIHEYADESLKALLQGAGFQVSGATGGKGRLLDSELASALQGEPVGTLTRGPKPKAERLAPFDAIMIVSKTNDSALNSALGRALVDCGLIKQFDQEVDLGTGLTRKSDLVCDPHLEPVRIEMLWRTETRRSEIANYVLTKLYNYGRAIGFL